MFASRAKYLPNERSPATIEDSESFVAFIVQERANVIVRLRTRAYEAFDGEAKDQALMRLLDRLAKFLNVLEEAPMTNRVFHGSNLAQILSDVANDPSLSPHGCKAAAEELLARASQTNYGAAERCSLDKPKLGTGGEYGHGNHTPGDRWPKNSDVVSAKIHRLTQQGIDGHALSGTYSIVVKHQSSGGLNEDKGLVIEYSTVGSEKASDDAKVPAPNRATFSLRASLLNKRPVRVLRKAGAKKGDRWGPKSGYRYDGLFKVTKATEMPRPNNNALYESFTLERLPLEDNMGWSLQDCIDGQRRFARE
ncbi:Putative PUA-like superfamily, SRA-YDG superfamily protein [Septoria linicola]|uniref:PUA-like superfamily, SRA-YDG superfamily protein n=1 Tax=Septoria linicola TaxID=215465 RepID=A0A9Q9EPA1_9PEZI|nr:putative PUA-like superfamily, SRA-YDG superfamily protein [Septoria linicola]USW57449.1 Putative PUA-like superfamily, SRA-YDG superfamily protein [Septoria linicola]